MGPIVARSENAARFLRIASEAYASSYYAVHRFPCIDRNLFTRAHTRTSICALTCTLAKRGPVPLSLVPSLPAPVFLALAACIYQPTDTQGQVVRLRST